MRLTKKEAIRKTLVKEICGEKLKLPILLIETHSPVGKVTGGKDLLQTDLDNGRGSDVVCHATINNPFLRMV